MANDEMIAAFKALLRKKHEYFGDNWTWATWAEHYEGFSEVCGFKVEKPEGTAKRRARHPTRQRFAQINGVNEYPHGAIDKVLERYDNLIL